VNLIKTIKSWFSGAEGSYRGAATGWSQWGNSFSIPMGDGFQAGLSMQTYDASYVPTAYACVMANARAVSMCYPKHVVVNDEGEHEKSLTSPASRVLRTPNSYQTFPQFMLNTVATMLFEGEAFIGLERDNRFAVNAMHLMPKRSCSPYVEPETNEIFYSLGSNPMTPSGMKYMIPARDMIHIRQYTPRHPLIGESSLAAAALSLGVNVALSTNQVAFYSQMSRPSGILSTDAALTKDQMLALRAAFDEQSKGMNAGKIPVLSNGLKFQPMGVTSTDADTILALKMSQEQIASVFGVPLPVIGDLSSATMNNTEAIVNLWLSTGLGSLLENLERSFDVAFGLDGNTQYIEFDPVSLLRMDFAARVDGLTKSIQGGLLSPNEAREKENLPPVEFGDEPMVQQQMVPLSVLELLHAATIKSKLKPVEQPAPAPKTEDEPEDDPEESKAMIAKSLEGIKYVH
jgi:HK97 family phage portal protein